MNEQDGGSAFLGLLTILFIALKLIGVIAWSWWLVLAPLWIAALVGICLAIPLLIVIHKAKKGE